MKPRIIVTKKLPIDNPPHPENSPLLIHKDIDMGWIIEMVVDGEYEVQNLPCGNYKNEEVDFDLAHELAEGKPILFLSEN